MTERTLLDDGAGPLRDAWEANAAGFIAWARAGLDSYWRYHRDQFLELVPPPGRLTLDVGCGEGRLARDFKALGHNVVAIDASPTMVAHAREADQTLDVRLADAAALPLDDGSADLAVAFMSLQDIDDLEGAARELGRVVAPGGRACIAVVHPLNSAGLFLRDDDERSPFVIEGSYLDRFRFRDHVERDGLAMELESEHRPIGDYVDALAEAGFLLERPREPDVPDSADSRPASRRWQRIPLFLHLRAIRAGG